MGAVEQVGLVGVGLLGGALAERLMGAGIPVLCTDTSDERCTAAAQKGARIASTVTEVAAQCRRIVLSLPDSDVVRRATADMSATLRPGHILIDTTTGDPADTLELARQLASLGVEYLDATVSGSSEQARQGDIVLMVGGRPEVYESCRDLLEAFSARCFYLGPCGSGQSMKLVSNLVMGLNRAALAEGIAFAEALGMDGDGVLRVLMAGLAYSRVMETKGQKMLRRDFKPQARLSQHLKDVRLMLEASERAGLKLVLTEAHRQLLVTAESAGLGDADNSAIIQAYSRGGGTD
jgi:3-hydroxyisobutyrate dehydrogenase-like beta-hydroxyacid dehydrogenase